MQLWLMCKKINKFIKWVFYILKLAKALEMWIICDIDVAIDK